MEFKKLIQHANSIIACTKELKPFYWECCTIDNNQGPSQTESGIIKSDELSMSAGNGSYKFHAIIRTDTGTYRMGSNYKNFSDERWNPNRAMKHDLVDRNSIEINKAIDSLMLCKKYLTAASGYSLKEKVKDIEGFTKLNTSDDILLFNRSYLNPIYFVSPSEYNDFKSKNHIQKIDFLLSEIRTLRATLLEKKRVDMIEYYHDTVFADAASNLLIDAYFWLEYELERVKVNPVSLKEQGK